MHKATLRQRVGPHTTPEKSSRREDWMENTSSTGATLQLGSPMEGKISQSTPSRNLWRYEGSPYKISHQNVMGGRCGWRNVVVLVVGMVLLCAPWIHHIQAHWTVKSMKNQLEQLQQEQRKVQKEVLLQAETYKNVKADSAAQKAENDELLGQLKIQGDAFEDFDSEAYQEAEEIEDAYLQRVSDLEKEIQRSSIRILIAKGFALRSTSAPIRAVIVLSESIGTWGNQLVLEMGPSHTYSHAIEFFVTMIEQSHFFDGLTLVRNHGSSVISTTPINYVTKKIESASSIEHFEMKSKGVKADHLAVLEYPQYEEDYPIEKYSILFADHGPHFYINMSDKINELQVSKSEVCFAQVVQGREILDYIMAHHHDDRASSTFMIGIESLRMMDAVEEDIESSKWIPIQQRNIEYKIRELTVE